MGIILNVTSQDEHVPEIGRFIRMVKERVRAIVNTFPFKQYPNRLIFETVYNTIFWLNRFPHRNGIHPTLCPCTIITSSMIDYNKHCMLQFGSYMQVHEPHNNSLIPRTTGAIALRPSGNAQGGNYFMSLTSRKRIIGNKWTVLPMPAEVIATMHQLAAACKKYKGFVFTDKDGNIIDEINDENNTLENDTKTSTNNKLEITGVDMMETNTNTLETTGVDNNNYTGHITGVGNNITGVDNNEYNNAPDMDNKLHITRDSKNEDHKQYYDDISIENETPDDIHRTINDMNTIHEINAGQLNVDPDTGEVEKEETDAPTHSYNI